MLDERDLTYWQNFGNCSCRNTVPYPRVAPESTTNMFLYTMMLGSCVYLHFLSKNMKVKLCVSHIRGRTQDSTVLRNIFWPVRE